MPTATCDHLPSDPCVTSCTTEPQGIHTCSDCGDRFRNATDWIDHTTPRCKAVEARERLSRELQQAEARRVVAEHRLWQVYGDYVEITSHQSALEAIGRFYDSTAAGCKGVAREEWEHRANIVFQAAEEIQSEGL